MKLPELKISKMNRDSHNLFELNSVELYAVNSPIIITVIIFIGVGPILIVAFQLQPALARDHQFLGSQSDQSVLKVDQENVILKVHRMLKPGGLFITSPSSSPEMMSEDQNCSVVIRINDFGSAIMVFANALVLGNMRSK